MISLSYSILINKGYQPIYRGEVEAREKYPSWLEDILLANVYQNWIFFLLRRVVSYAKFGDLIIDWLMVEIKCSVIW